MWAKQKRVETGELRAGRDVAYIVAIHYTFSLKSILDEEEAVLLLTLGRLGRQGLREHRPVDGGGRPLSFSFV
jgi:hypothetical protein